MQINIKLINIGINQLTPNPISISTVHCHPLATGWHGIDDSVLSMGHVHTNMATHNIMRIKFGTFIWEMFVCCCDNVLLQNQNVHIHNVLQTIFRQSKKGQSEDQLRLPRMEAIRQSRLFYIILTLLL